MLWKRYRLVVRVKLGGLEIILWEVEKRVGKLRISENRKSKLLSRLPARCVRPTSTGRGFLGGVGYHHKQLSS
jgi:hypothetical protein